MVLVIFLFKYNLIISSSELVCCSICLCNVESLSLIKKSMSKFKWVNINSYWLEDVAIEAQIFAECVRQHKKMDKLAELDEGDV